MKKIFMFAISVTLLVSGCAKNNIKQHWGYSGAEAPAKWAQLSSDNFACNGKNQSPINLTGSINSELEPIKFNYQANGGGENLVNNGHTLQVNYTAGSSITIDQQEFKLLQFHFHAPSENHINDTSYPLEAHFVHADRNGNLAVIAVMYKEGKENQGLKQAWANIPQHKGDQHKFAKLIAAQDFLPANKDYYRFNGSLTTPPCSEGVRWLVMKTIETASKQQINAFKQILHEPNNRPLQPLNARPVLQ